MFGNKDYYSVLEIQPNSTSFEIEKAYERLASFWHPDKHKLDRIIAERKFHDICEAYEHLSDRNRRLHYDEMINRNFSIDDAHSTFQRFFQEHGFGDEKQRNFFNQNYGTDKRNYYEILEIPRNASQIEIKNAYRRLAMKYHPKNNPNDPSAHDRFLSINQAYEALSNQSKRENYDDFKLREMMPTRAHGIFQNFMGDKFFDFPQKNDQFFKPILKKKWSRDLDNLMLEDQDKWRNIDEGETVKSSTVQKSYNGQKSRKTVTTSKKVNNGVSETITTEQYDFPNGTKEIRKIIDDGRGTINTNVYHLNAGERLPIDA